MLRAALSAILVAVMCAPALAMVDLPRFDLHLRCAAMGSHGARTCEHSEEAARHALLAHWPRYPARRKQACVQAEQRRPEGQRSYVTLSRCLGSPNVTG
jgi:hypothetical protein